MPTAINSELADLAIQRANRYVFLAQAFAHPTAERKQQLDEAAAQLLMDGGRQIIPAEWIRKMETPNAIAPFYGLLTWLNKDGRMFADASRASWFMFGAGGNAVWLDPENEAVVVWRWLDGAHAPAFVKRVV